MKLGLCNCGGFLHRRSEEDEQVWECTWCGQLLLKLEEKEGDNA